MYACIYVANKWIENFSAITWTNVDLWSVRFCGIHLIAISQKIFQDIYRWNEIEIY